MNKDSWLKHFPVALFSSVMGLAGLALAWQRAEQLLLLPIALSRVMTYVTFSVFIVIGMLYLAKLARFPRAVLTELQHLRKLNLFPAISISLMLSAVLVLDEHRTASLALWATGAALQFMLTFHAMSAWLFKPGFELAHTDPVWFFPLVGNMVAATTGVEHAPTELLWFFFSVGFSFWLAMFMAVFQRLIFHAPFPEQLTPTFFVLIAPPAVAFLAYYGLVGRLDAFARVLYYAALFMTVLLFANLGRFLRLRFSLAAWSYTFPLAAVVLASLVMYQEIGGSWLRAIASLLLVIVTTVVLVLLIRTGVAFVRGQICIPDA